jgi:hypothetical protein
LDELRFLVGDWVGDVSGGDWADLTRAHFAIHVGDRNLTSNENSRTHAVENGVIVSVGAVAEWLVHSWWRLRWETSPDSSMPTTEWRVAHELASAGEGFVWPAVGFASDLVAMRVRSRLARDRKPQSVRYLDSLDAPATVSFANFDSQARALIDAVVTRLENSGCVSTLPDNWRQLQEEIADPELAHWRRIEAQLGFYADRCPENTIERAHSLEDVVGERTAAEVLPAFFDVPGTERVDECESLMESDGLEATPDEVSPLAIAGVGLDQPWRVGVATARNLRRDRGVSKDLLPTRSLCDWLGIAWDSYQADAPPAGKRRVGLAIRQNGKGYRFHLRKKLDVGRRFELARALGDLVLSGTDADQALAWTDMATSRQQYQRAFAAELLCPIADLCDSPSSARSIDVEEQAYRFKVSEWVVRHQLRNNFGQAESESWWGTAGGAASAD